MPAPKSPDASPLKPLHAVTFNQATSIPGSDIMLLTVVAKETRLVGGSEFICPQPYLDLVTDKIVIEGRYYPMSRVHFYEPTRMAKSVAIPLPINVEDYTIGPRVPRRIVVTPKSKA